jgi:putative membrane protein
MPGSVDLLQRALRIWEWEPSILIGLFLWQAAYLWLTSRRWGKARWNPVSLGRKITFSVGTLLAFLALVSPIDYISDHYLFSVHMLQHLLLIMVAPPFWLLGLPDNLLDGIGLPWPVKTLARWITHPVVAFLIFNSVVLIWHAPSFYEAALENNNLHILEYLMFMAVAIIGWWPMFGCSRQVAPRLSLPLQVLYMFFMMFPTTILGALITLDPTPWIPFYVHAPRLWELASSPGQAVTTFGQTANGWGLSVMDDQQAAGLLMWVPGNMIFMATGLISLFKWFQDMQRKDG